MVMKRESVKNKTSSIASAQWNVCLATTQKSLEELIVEYLGRRNVRVKQKLSDLIGERGCNLYIVDTKIPDIDIWPAPIAVDSQASLKPWIFLLSKTSDASLLSSLPTKTMFFGSNRPALDKLTSFLRKLLDPETGRKIERVSYLEKLRSFVIHFGNGKAYVVKVNDLTEADPSRVIQYRIGRNHYHFNVRQESGNSFEVPWDEILYHCEPAYEYYKGRQTQTVDQDRARRIGGRVRELRIAKGISIEELAQKAGLKRPNLSRLEHGKHVPHLETLERLATALGVPVANIVAQSSEVKQILPVPMPKPTSTKIKVIGLGGGGCNAVTRMVREGIQDVEFIAMNTDAQALSITEALIRIQIGEKLTKGLGVGGDHVKGAKAAEESRNEIRDVVSGADMVFITCGMGGGTGTAAAPVVAEIAKQSGALTIAVVTKPFTFEGTHRYQVADEGITRLLGKVDTLIIIPSDHLLELSDRRTGVDNAFKLADEVMSHAVVSIIQLVTVPGLINLDFADVKAVMKDAGPAWMSIGMGSGQNRAADAAKEALASPLLDVSIGGSKSLLFSVVGSSNLTLFEINEAAEVIKQALDPEANIIFGVAHDPAMDKEVRITLIATGFISRLGMPGVSEEEELTQLLKGVKSEDELNVPSFLRRPLFSSRRRPGATSKDKSQVDTK